MLDNRTVKFTLQQQPPTGLTQWQYYNKTQEALEVGGCWHLLGQHEPALTVTNTDTNNGFSAHR